MPSAIKINDECPGSLTRRKIDVGESVDGKLQCYRCGRYFRHNCKSGAGNYVTIPRHGRAKPKTAKPCKKCKEWADLGFHWCPKCGRWNGPTG